MEPLPDTESTMLVKFLPGIVKVGEVSVEVAGPDAPLAALLIAACYVELFDLEQDMDIAAECDAARKAGMVNEASAAFAAIGCWSYAMATTRDVERMVRKDRRSLRTVG